MMIILGLDYKWLRFLKSHSVDSDTSINRNIQKKIKVLNNNNKKIFLNKKFKKNK